MKLVLVLSVLVALVCPYVFAGTISSIAPSNGPLEGGYYVTISGSSLGYNDITSVTFGGVAGYVITQSSSSVVVIAPAQHSPGSYSVTLSSVSLGVTNFCCFAFNPAPIIYGVNPTQGPDAGGNYVTISGANLGSGADITYVSLAGIVATIVAQTPSSVVVVAGSSPSPVSGGSVVVSSTSTGYSYMASAYSYGNNQICLPNYIEMAFTSISPVASEDSSIFEVMDHNNMRFYSAMTTISTGSTSNYLYFNGTYYYWNTPRTYCYSYQYTNPVAPICEDVSPAAPVQYVSYNAQQIIPGSTILNYNLFNVINNGSTYQEQITAVQYSAGGQTAWAPLLRTMSSQYSGQTTMAFSFYAVAPNSYSVSTYGWSWAPPSGCTSQLSMEDMPHEHATEMRTFVERTGGPSTGVRVVQKRVERVLASSSVVTVLAAPTVVLAVGFVATVALTSAVTAAVLVRRFKKQQAYSSLHA